MHARLRPTQQVFSSSLYPKPEPKPELQVPYVATIGRSHSLSISYNPYQAVIACISSGMKPIKCCYLQVMHTQSCAASINTPKGQVKCRQI